MDLLSTILDPPIKSLWFNLQSFMDVNLFKKQTLKLKLPKPKVVIKFSDFKNLHCWSSVQTEKECQK